MLWLHCLWHCKRKEEKGCQYGMLEVMYTLDEQIRGRIASKHIFLLSKRPKELTWRKLRSCVVIKYSRHQNSHTLEDAQQDTTSNCCAKRRTGTAYG